MLLEKECEALGHWFEQTYPMYELAIHQGRGKGNREEYNLDLTVGTKTLGSQLFIPADAEKQDVDYLRIIRDKFIEVQKRAITSAVSKMGGIPIVS